ncbi:hypothetical protein GCM10009850_106090 [Nonomuraea monospora]|uniref:Uncharacterized protein n=1 Tax=Nonomuraea monospora TaxID=568818 RepID=A0ABN3D049_9ACTN
MNLCGIWGVLNFQGGPIMHVLDGVAPDLEQLRLELILIQALHEEAERLAAD